jgi:hypothetical protein
MMFKSEIKRCGVDKREIVFSRLSQIFTPNNDYNEYMVCTARKRTKDTDNFLSR